MQDFVDIDGFEIPTHQAAAYQADRESFALAAQAVFEKCADKVCRLFARSEEGEAVVGVDKDGAIVCMVHLNPITMEQMRAARQAGTLQEYFTDLRHFPYL